MTRLSVGLMGKDFEVIPVDEQLGSCIRIDETRVRIPMADSIIAATAKILKTCVTDDPHIEKIREIKTRWII